MRWLICKTVEGWNELRSRIEAFRNIPNEIWDAYARQPIGCSEGFAMPIIDEAIGALTDIEIDGLVDSLPQEETDED
jgi:hypothetical protein